MHTQTLNTHAHTHTHAHNYKYINIHTWFIMSTIRYAHFCVIYKGKNVFRIGPWVGFPFVLTFKSNVFLLCNNGLIFTKEIQRYINHKSQTIAADTKAKIELKNLKHKIQKQSYPQLQQQLKQQQQHK